MPPASQALSASQKGASKFLPDISSKANVSPKACALNTTKTKRPASRSSRVSEVSWGSDETRMSECICTICDCGKHACPVHKWQPTEFNGNSRYREDYPAHLIHPRNRAAQDRSVHLTPADPDHFKSKYLEDFQAYDPDPAKSMKPKESLSASVPFTGMTTNQEVYTPKNAGPLVRRRPRSPGREQLPFDGTTTNREQFIPFPDSKPRESMAPRQTMLASAPFDGHTSYKEDYPAHDVEGYKKKRDAHAPYEYGGPRDLETEQRAAYTKKPIHLCPALLLPKKDPSMKTGHIHYTKRHNDPAVTYSATF